MILRQRIFDDANGYQVFFDKGYLNFQFQVTYANNPSGQIHLNVLQTGEYATTNIIEVYKKTNPFGIRVKAENIDKLTSPISVQILYFYINAQDELVAGGQTESLAIPQINLEIQQLQTFKVGINFNNLNDNKYERNFPSFIFRNSDNLTIFNVELKKNMNITSAKDFLGLTTFDIYNNFGNAFRKIIELPNHLNDTIQPLGDSATELTLIIQDLDISDFQIVTQETAFYNEIDIAKTTDYSYKINGNRYQFEPTLYFLSTFNFDVEEYEVLQSNKKLSIDGQINSLKYHIRNLDDSVSSFLTDIFEPNNELLFFLDITSNVESNQNSFGFNLTTGFNYQNVENNEGGRKQEFISGRYAPACETAEKIGTYTILLTFAELGHRGDWYYKLRAEDAIGAQGEKLENPDFDLGVWPL